MVNLPIRHIKNAVAKGAEIDGGVFEAISAREGDMQEADMVPDWRCDGGDKEQDASYEEEEDTEPAERELMRWRKG